MTLDSQLQQQQQQEHVSVLCLPCEPIRDIRGRQPRVVCPGGKKNTNRFNTGYRKYTMHLHPVASASQEQATDRQALGTTGAVYYTAPWQWRRFEIEIALTSPAPVDMTDPTWPLAFGLLSYRYLTYLLQHLRLRRNPPFNPSTHHRFSLLSLA
ncbi:hypothetical protein Landi51_02880 [Colletotrichum acutatum]